MVLGGSVGELERTGRDVGVLEGWEALRWDKGQAV